MGIDQMSKMNENIGERNRYQKAEGKRRLVQNYQEISSRNLLGTFYRYYGKEGYRVLENTTRKPVGKAEGQIYRDVSGNADLR